MQRACQTTIGAAEPPVRLAAVVEGMGPRGFFNAGLDDQGKRVPATICQPDYKHALRFIGRSIAADLTGRCIPAPLLIPGGPDGPVARAACARGERPVRDGPACERGTLHEAVCTVERVSRAAVAQDPTGQPPGTAVARCPRELFDDPTDRRCAGACPCWRIVPSAACRAEVAGSPHALELLTDSPPDGDTLLRATCLTSTHAWGSAAIAR